MNKKIAIIATNGFEDSELLYPFIRLKEAGHTPELLSLSPDKISGKHGVPMIPDLTIEEANPGDYHGLILPGGNVNPDQLRRHRPVLDFVGEMENRKKLIAAICHAGWVLISAKVVKGKKATSYYSIRDDMVNAGALFEDSAVVIDHNLITSRKPDDLPDFMKAILNYLE